MSAFKVTITTPNGKEVYSEEIAANGDYQAVFAAALEYRNENATKLCELYPADQAELMATLLTTAAFRDLTIKVDHI